MNDLNKTRVAIVTDWLTTPGGAEKVVEAMAEIWPQADIYTSVSQPEKFPWLKGRKLVNSWVNRLPFKNKHQLYSLARPVAFESFDLSKYDLVISSASAEAKSLITKPETVHICYCHTPIRYFWSDYHDYLEKRLEFGWLNPIVRLLMPYIVNKLRMVDRLSAEKVDFFVANSQYVANRIRKYYRRNPAVVIYPPVDMPIVEDAQIREGDYFVFVGRLVPYKNADLVVQAFVENGRELRVVGNGPMLGKLKQMAAGHDNIKLLSEADDKEKHLILAGCRGLIFPSLEDFGIVPLEAMIYGKPVIAYGQGGALETVKPGLSGCHFPVQSAESLNQTLTEFDDMVFDQEKIKTWATEFNRDRFKREIKELAERLLAERNGLSVPESQII